MRLRWTRRALADLGRIADRIAADKPAAATEFVKVVAEKVARLQEFPLLGRAGAYQDTRELVVHKNYLVTYRVRGEDIDVLQVWHLARHLPRGPL
ncbi:MAG: type II toxin-antitoxin system RelE/ParE family toxin [Cytophagales bacterium]|nr:type II toxin-antitoxin system RelE/ParE family toxin [Rhizobacter sp.]